MVRKGEITSTQLVMLIILIVSFVVVISFLYKIYNWNTLIDKESCHESIVFRSSVNFGFIKSSKIIPLKCRTEKICLSMSGEDCVQVGKNSKENPVTKIKLDKDPAKARSQIIDQLTESMRECHSMLGEGKLLFMPNNVLGGEKYWTATNYCLICSRVVLDEEARDKIGDISYAELYQALGNKALPDKRTYLEYLHPGWKDWHSIGRLFGQLKEEGLPQLKEINNIEEWKIKLSEEKGFAIVSQIAPKSYWVSFTKAGVGLGTVALGATLIGAPVAVGIAGAGIAGGAIFWYSSPTGEFAYSPPTVLSYNLENLRAMNCDSFEIAT